MKIKVLMLLITLFSITACVKVKKEVKNEKKIAFVSILPLKQFAQIIAGSEYDIKVMVTPGQSPATYEPTVKQLKQISKAKIFFAAGVAFEESWLKKIKSLNPDILIVDTTEGIKKREMDDPFISDENHEEHVHEKHEEHFEHEHKEDHHHHHHGKFDPHTWLNPKFMDIQCKNMVVGFTELNSKNSTNYFIRYDEISIKLNDLHSKLINLSLSKHSNKLLVFHPAWGYLTDVLYIKQVPIELHGKEPTAMHMKKIADLAKQYKIRHIIIQKQFSAKASTTIADMIGGEVISLDPLAEDYFANFELIIKTLKKALKA